MKRMLLPALALVLVAGALVVTSSRRIHRVAAPHQREFVADFGRGLTREFAYRPDLTIRHIDRRIETRYQTEITDYLSLADRPLEKSEDLRKKLVEPFLENLRHSGVSVRDQGQMLSQLGKHYYNEALIWRSEPRNQPDEKFTKLRLLKLAVAHLDAAQGIGL